MNTHNKRTRLKLQNNLVTTKPLFTTNPIYTISLEKAKRLINNGCRLKELITKYNILPINIIELYKFEQSLNTINDKKQITSTIDNKTHELSFIVNKNEKQNSLLDDISKEIRGLFSSNKNLKNFSLSTR